MPTTNVKPPLREWMSRRFSWMKPLYKVSTFPIKIYKLQPCEVGEPVVRMSTKCVTDTTCVWSSFLFLFATHPSLSTSPSTGQFGGPHQTYSKRFECQGYPGTKSSAKQRYSYAATQGATVGDCQGTAGGRNQRSSGRSSRSVLGGSNSELCLASGCERSDTQGFLDGDLEDCIAALLRRQAKEEQDATLQGESTSS